MQKLKSLKGLLITCMILFCAATFANQPEAVDMDSGDGYKKGKMTRIRTESAFLSARIQAAIQIAFKNHQRGLSWLSLNTFIYS